MRRRLRVARRPGGGVAGGEGGGEGWIVDGIDRSWLVYIHVYIYIYAL